MRCSWRKAGWLGLLIAFILGFTGPFEAKEIDVAYNALPFNLPSIVEKSQGFLAQEGYSVKYHSFGAGYAMSEAMAAGRLDLAPVMGATSAIIGAAAGREIKVIGVYSQAPAAFGLAARPDSLTLGDLRGKKIAVPIGTEAHLLLAKILAEEGLTLRDVQLVNLLVPDGVAALQGGQVDAAMVVEPAMSRLSQSGSIIILRDGAGLISGLTLSVTRADMAESAPIEAFKRAHARSLDYLNKNYEQALLLAGSALNLPAEIVDMVAQKYVFSGELTEKHRIELAETIQFLHEEGLIRQRLAVQDLFVD